MNKKNRPIVFGLIALAIVAILMLVLFTMTDIGAKLNLGNIVCSASGSWSALCFLLVVPILGAVVGAILFFLYGIHVPIIPNIVFIIGGALLGAIFASFFAAYWLPILLVWVALQFFKKKVF